MCRKVVLVVSTHNKHYSSQMEELEKHLVWLSNKAFVEQHNVNDELGLSLLLQNEAKSLCRLGRFLRVG